MLRRVSLGLAVALITSLVPPVAMASAARAADSPFVVERAQPVPPRESVTGRGEPAPTTPGQPLPESPRRPEYPRTQRMETTLGVDGRITARIYPEPVFRKDGSGWARIDARVRKESHAVAVEAPYALHRLRFGATTDDLLDLAVDGGSIRLQFPEGAVGAPALADDTTVVYRNVAAATDLRFRSFTGGVRTELWLNSKAAPTSFAFHLSDPKGLLGELRRQEDGSYRSEKRIDEENHLVIERAVAYTLEAKGEAGPEATSAELAVVRSGDGWTITKSVDPAWVAQQSFPVVLDPTLSYNTGPDISGPDFNGTGDCYIATDPYTANSYCGYDYLKAGNPGYGTTSAYKLRTLLRFEDIANVPANAYISSARVGLHQFGAKAVSTYDYDMYELSQDWQEPNWTERYDNSGTLWTTAGGTVMSGIRATAAQIEATTATPAYGDYTWFTGAGLTAMVRRWRTTGLDSRYGLLLRGKENNADSRTFLSSRGAPSATGMPVLEITYSIPNITAIAGDGVVKIVWPPQTSSVTKHVVTVFRDTTTPTQVSTGDVVCATRASGVSVGLCPRHTVVEGLTNGSTYYATVATHLSNGTITTATSNEVVPSAPAGMMGREPWWTYDEATKTDPSGNVAVNVANSNIVLDQVDSTPMQGHGRMGYVVRRTYNSHLSNDDTLPGSVGAGWTLNVGEVDGDAAGFVGMLLNVPLNTPLTNTSASIYLTDRDGTSHKFVPRSTTNRQVLVSVAGAAFTEPVTGLGALLPRVLRAGLDPAMYDSVCIDRRYTAPAGVELALWRYVALNSGTAPCTPQTGTTPVILGYAAMRPDRLRTEYSFDGRILSMVDGTGTELRYLYQGGVPKAGVVLGNLEAVFEPRSCSAAGLGISGAEVTLASSIPTGCRAFRFTHDLRGLVTSVTDPAGRVTTYASAFTAEVPQPHLISVTNPDSSVLEYRTRGINNFDSRCATGYLCVAEDARGSMTQFIHHLHSSIPGIHAVRWIDVRGGGRWSYERGTGTFVSYSGNSSERREFALIDGKGRVARIRDTDANGTQIFRETEMTWDSDTGIRCNAPAPGVDNNLCTIVRKAVGTGGGPAQTTQFTYNVDGALLTLREGDTATAPTTTYGYESLYYGLDNTAEVWDDRVDGYGKVTSEGTARTAPSGLPYTYVTVDRVAMLPPRGNTEPDVAVRTGCDTRDACRRYLTRFVVDNVATTTPNAVVTSGFCGTNAAPGTPAANSGLVCEVTGPVYDNPATGAGTHARTLFRYDQFGQRTLKVTPEAVRRNTQTSRYEYHYFDDSELDLSGKVSAGGWLRGVTDPAGKFVAFGYDRAGNVIRTWDRRATSRTSHLVTAYPGSLATPPSTEYTQVLYGPGDTTGADPAAVHAPWRFVRSHRDPLGNVTTHCVDANGNPQVTRSPRGTLGSFDPPCPVKHATAGKYDTLYDTLNWQGQTYIDSSGNVMHAPTADDMRASVVRPGNHTGNGTSTHVGDRFLYANGRLVWIADGLNNKKVIQYDWVGRPVKTRWTRGSFGAGSASDCQPGTQTGAGDTPLPAGRTLCETTTAYDSLDNVTSESDAAGGRTDYEYDSSGRRTATVVLRTAATKLRHQWVYDVDGNAVRYCSPRQFGAGDELTESAATPVTDCPDGAAGRFSEHMAYDPAGQLATRTRYREQAGAGTSRTAAVEALTERMTYDADGNMTTYADPRATAGATVTHTVRREYDLLRQLVTQRVPYGSTAGSDYVTTYTYDPAGNLLAETKPGSTATTPRITAYTYDALNRVRDTVQGAESTNGSTGRPDSVGGRNVRTRQLYDRDGNTVGIYGPRAFTTSVSDPDPSFLTRIDVDADDQPVVYHVPRSSAAVTDSVHTNVECNTVEDSVWWYEPDTVTVPATMDPVPAYPAAEKIALCRSWVDYDAVGRLSRYIPPQDVSHTGTSSYQVDYRYSDDGLLVEIENPGANDGDARDVTKMRYDGAGRRRSVTESVNSRTWQWNHALDGTLTSASLPPSIGGNTHDTGYTYNLAGQVVTTTNPEGEVVTTRHHADGLLAEQKDGGGNIVRHVYDRNGNPIRTYSPAAVHSIAYPGSPDATNPSGTPTSNFFNLANQLTTTLVPTAFNGTEVRRTDYSYDSAARREDTTTYLASCATTNGRCEPNDLTGVTAITGRSSGTQSLSYYQNDRVRQRLGRGSAPRPAIGYGYDAAGNVTTITDSTNSSATITATYYLDGLVRTVEDGTGSGAYRTDYNYTGDGLLDVRRNVPRGTSATTAEMTHYDYNYRRLLSDWDDYRENSGNNGANDITYDADGRPLAVESYDEKTTFSHDDDDTLISKTVTSKLDDQPLLAKWSYTYDKAQRVTSQQLQGQSVAYWNTPTGNGAGTPGSLDDRTYTYSYDDAGRLDTFAQGTSSVDIDHDRNGNRTKYGTTTTTYNPDDTIRTSGSSSTPHTYAPFGGHTSDNCTTNTYDAFDRLLSLSVTGTGCGATVSSTYNYDGLDRQRSETGSVNDGLQTRTLSAAMHYDGLGGALAVEVRGAGDWLRYILDPSGEAVGSVIPNTAGSGTEFAHFDDGAGNLGLIIQTGGHRDTNVTPPTMDHFGCSTRFDPYGDPVGRSDDGTNVCNTGTTSTTRLYRGARRDPLTSAYQFGSRTYAPGRAGFLTPDTFSAAGTESNLGISVDPLTRNSYAYVNGDPINLYDPTGHGWKEIREKGWGWLKGGVKQLGGVAKGFTDALTETGKGAVQVAWAGVALTGLRGQDAFNQTWNQTTEIYDAVKSDPWGAGKAIVGSFAQGFREDWKNGNYGEAVGRGLFAALSSLAGGGGIATKLSGIDTGAATRRVLSGLSARGDTLRRGAGRAAAVLSETAASARTRASGVLNRARYGPDGSWSPEAGMVGLGRGGGGDAVPDPLPVLNRTGGPDRSSAVYVSVRRSDGTIETVGSRRRGIHAEDVAQQIEPGGLMSRPFGWRRDAGTGDVTWQPINVCVQCQQKYPASLFPPGTRGDAGGAWG